MALAAVLGAVMAASAAPRPAAAHGGPVSIGVNAARQTGPLASYLQVRVDWIGDGDPAEGLNVVLTGTGPGGSIGPLGMSEGAAGLYSAAIQYPAGGSWQLTVTAVGQQGSPLVLVQEVEGAAPPSPPDSTPSTGPANGSPGSPATPGATGPPGSAEAGGAPTGESDATSTGGSTTGGTGSVTGPPVVIVPTQVARRSVPLLTFAVPAVAGTAPTTAITITMPPEANVFGFAVRPVPGWAALVTWRPVSEPIRGAESITQVVDQITWTATTTGLHAGEVLVVAMTAGPMPRRGTAIAFPVTAIALDGTLRAWTDTTARSASAAPRVRLVRPRPHSGTTLH